MKSWTARGRAWATTTAPSILFAAIAVTLHGCTVPHVDGYIDIGDVGVGSHVVPHWRMQQDYFEASSYKDPMTKLPAFNSCMDTQLNVLDVCSRRGRCVAFDENDIAHPTFFCKCDDGWAGQECTVRRKRQSVSWLLSLVLGPAAVDEVYLGRAKLAGLKLTVSCVGLAGYATGNVQAGTMAFLGPWLFDVVRLGMCPALSKSYRVAPDLPRWVFAASTMLYFGLVALALGVASVHAVVPGRRRRRDALGLSSPASAKRAAL